MTSESDSQCQQWGCLDVSLSTSCSAKAFLGILSDKQDYKAPKTNKIWPKYLFFAVYRAINLVQYSISIWSCCSFSSFDRLLSESVFWGNKWLPPEHLCFLGIGKCQWFNVFLSELREVSKTANKFYCCAEVSHFVNGNFFNIDFKRNE